MFHRFLILVFTLIACFGQSLWAQVAVRGKLIYTMEGQPIEDGTIVIRDGKIAAIGKSNEMSVPNDFEIIEAAVVTPGLIDAHSTVGLSGMLNQDEDQDQLEHSNPIQPALRAFDAFNSRDELIPWVRGFGVTTINTGHAPGELVSGQTMVVKTIEGGGKDAILVETRAVATTLSTEAKKTGKASPGTRGKMLEMLRSKLLAAREYQQKLAKAESGSDDSEEDKKDPPSRDLELETLADVLAKKTPLLITAHRGQDITNALRLAKEFDFKLWLDGAAEAYLLIDEIKQAQVPVLIHPSMARAVGDRENLSFETASKLVKAGIPVAMQSGYEAYVPKTRVVLFEAAIAAANGLTFEQTLASITINSAKILGVADRVGSIKIGKDGDLALNDGAYAMRRVLERVAIIK
ncbi:MAG: amidohydrolase family protein, partial [Planctomycetota bacterium]